MRAWEKVKEMTDEELVEAWAELRSQSYCIRDMYDEITTMDEWEIFIYDEMEDRELLLNNPESKYRVIRNQFEEY